MGFSRIRKSTLSRRAPFKETVPKDPVKALAYWRKAYAYFRDRAIMLEDEVDAFRKKCDREIVKKSEAMDDARTKYREALCNISLLENQK